MVLVGGDSCILSFMFLLGKGKVSNLGSPVKLFVNKTYSTLPPPHYQEFILPDYKEQAQRESRVRIIVRNGAFHLEVSKGTPHQ